MPLPDDQLIAVDEALSRLAQLNERAAKVIELRFFGGLTESQVAIILNVTRRTVNRDWETARAWLYREINGGGGAGEAPCRRDPDSPLAGTGAGIAIGRLAEDTGEP
jgi:hypothetical protein